MTGTNYLLNNRPSKMDRNLLFHSRSMRIPLLRALGSNDYYDHGEEILKLSVTYVASIYGSKCICYKMHPLVQSAQDAWKFGPLDKVPALLFDIFLDKMNTFVCHPKNWVRQFIRRFHEKQNVMSLKIRFVFSRFLDQ